MAPHSLRDVISVRAPLWRYGFCSAYDGTALTTLYNTP